MTMLGYLITAVASAALTVAVRAIYDDLKFSMTGNGDWYNAHLPPCRNSECKGESCPVSYQFQEHAVARGVIRAVLYVFYSQQSSFSRGDMHISEICKCLERARVWMTREKAEVLLNTMVRDREIKASKREDYYRLW